MKLIGVMYQLNERNQRKERFNLFANICLCIVYLILIQEKKEQQQSQVTPQQQQPPPQPQQNTQSDNREELDFKFDEELPTTQTNSKTNTNNTLSSYLPSSFFPQNRRRTTSLTLDLHEESYVFLLIIFISFTVCIFKRK